MLKAYKTLSGHVQVDIVEYIAKYFEDHPHTQVLIGCDSQNRGPHSKYAIVIGLYTPGKGAHVLYRKIEIPRERDIVVRLINEVWYSTEIAEVIKNELGIVAHEIHIDLNPDPIYKSNQALATAVGIVTGMGYKVRAKRNSPMMTYAADTLCR
jgi:predicted RNase H-related nuclease YkuK (DUF458 family)